MPHPTDCGAQVGPKRDGREMGVDPMINSIYHPIGSIVDAETLREILNLMREIFCNCELNIAKVSKVNLTRNINSLGFKF